MTVGQALVNRTRNRRGEGQHLRQEILQAATDLLDETGSVHAITLRAVARRAGISAPSIYPHFANPQAILLAVVQEEFDRLREHLGAAAERAGNDAVARLVGMCRGYLEYARTQPTRYLLLVGGFWNAAEAIEESTVARADVVALGVAALDDFIALLQACVDDGGSTSTDPSTDGTALWVGLHGLAHQRIVSTALVWPPHVEDTLIRRLAQL